MYIIEMAEMLKNIQDLSVSFSEKHKIVRPNNKMYRHKFIPLVQMKFCRLKPFGVTNFKITVMGMHAVL